LILGPAVFDCNVLALDIAGVFKPWRNARRVYANASGDAGLRNPITGIGGCCALAVSGHADATEQRDELASLHSITSSARASNVGGTSSPNESAV